MTLPADRSAGTERAARIGAVVVLYHPPGDVLRNVESYLSQVDVLFAIDNSDSPDEDRIAPLRQLRNVVYHWNGGNVGLARALNRGAAMALEHRCDFLLMMDQDSVASSNLVSEFSLYCSGHPLKDIGLLAPFHAYRNFERPPESSKVREIPMTITSGTMLNLEAYRLVGPFLDELFIDYVDFEYCLRLRARGFRIIQLSGAVLDHALGNTVARTFLFRRVAVYNHDPVRVYYRFRNRLRVAWHYRFRFPGWSIRELFLFGNELVKILCFEDRKAPKCRMAFRGITDCFLNRFGKYEGRA
jgi:rhamnosyltransferase